MNLRKSFYSGLFALILLHSPFLLTGSISINSDDTESNSLLSPADGPSVVDGPVAYSRHMGNDRNQHRYGMYFSINVTDPQGTVDIASVVVTGPTSIVYTLSDPEIDGVWNLWTENYESPPAIGAYKFRVTDKSGNWIEATDNITAVLNYPGNVTPAHYSVTSSQTPVFRWDAVPGATGYNIHVADVNGNQIWYKNSFTTNSITYNDDVTATSVLISGNTYNWEVNAYDADGNTGEQDYWISFIYSTNTATLFLNNPNVKSAHYGDDYGNHGYYLQLGIQVSDPQGFNDIASVKVTGIGGTVYTMTDDDGDGYYNGWFSTSITAPQSGSYIFRATDKSGNWSEKVSVLTGSIDFPKNVQPVNNAVINSPVPVFSWDQVTGSVSNIVWVNDIYGRRIWGSSNLSGSSTSVTFNDDGLALEALKDGSSYTWVVQANDAYGNWGWHPLKFAYSSDVARPLIGSHDALTYHGGDDLGNEDWGYDIWLDVTDPQGSGDIASVVVIAPGGSTYTLTDPENDGRYSGWPRSSSQLQLGQCQFKVTDRSGNSATVYDTLYSWMDFARNITPSANQVVTKPAPTFHWDVVAGTSYYQVHVWPNGLPVIWGGINVYNRDSLVYNYNGTGQNLQTGIGYYWDLRAFDSKGNYGYHYGTEFFYSTSTTSPVLANTYAQSAHYGNDNGNHSYNLHFSTKAVDPQGLDDIISVVVTGPDQKTYTLNRTSDNSYYDGWFGGTTVIPILGPHKFRVTDKSGNWSEVTDNISAVLDYPKNLKPRQSEVVTTSAPTFRWSKIAGAVKYAIWVTDNRNRQIWRIDNLTDTSVVYNKDGYASGALKEGSSYLFNVTASDAENNYGEQNNRLFYYSLSAVKPVMTGNELRSRHWADGSFNEWWGIDCWLNVSDPQGLSDLDSVWIDGPGNYHQKLFDDGTNGDGTPGDSKYALSTGTSTPPLTGEYLLKSKDKAGNLVILIDTLKAVLDYPKGLNIRHNSIITLPDFPVSWSIVPGATRYEASVYTIDWSRNMWSSGRVTGLLSTKYNSNNTGASLSEGEVYNLVIRADDGDWGNESEINNVKFAFRSSNRHRIYVDSLNVSGIENGTLTSPYNTLTEAVARSITGDTILVAPGTYIGNIYDIGSVSLIGKDPLKTIIKGYLALLSPDVVIRGFGISGSDRSGIEVHENVNAVISNNIISDNSGSGITLGWNGPSTAIIRNNTIVNNGNGGVSVETSGSDATITNNIISKNVNGIWKALDATVRNSYNNLFANTTNLVNLQPGTGEIISDPKFLNLLAKNYSLSSASPAIDAGDPDLDGDGKTWIEDADDRDADTTRRDMGAVFLDQRLLIPNAPTGLITVSCNDLVTLKWRKNTGLYFLRYRIYGGTTPDPVTKIDSTSNNVADTSKVITGLTHGQTFYFKVVAVNRGGTLSKNNNQTSARIQTGVIPKIKSKWAGDVLICYNQGDSITKYQWYKNGATVSNGNSQYYVANKQSGVYKVETIDINGCKNTSKEISVTGTKSIAVYPNPASESFALKISDDSEGRAIVSIINSTGKKVIEFHTENTDGEILREIAVADLEDGIYYINVVMSNKESYSAKIVISR